MTIIDEIKNKADIVSEIEQDVPLQRSGKAFKGICPFHQERTPSFYVFPETQTWRCFGCNLGGDILHWVQEKQAVNFREALLYLAKKTGVTLPEKQTSPEEAERQKVRTTLLAINREAQFWFHQILLRSREAAAARKYLQQRGISSESIALFAVGYAPSESRQLLTYLQGKGYTHEELLLSGLFRVRDEHTQLFPYFYDRIIFPIRNDQGTIGFGARGMSGTVPKYVNSPQTPVFEKSEVLYGLDTAKEHIKRLQEVIIVEGYVDAIIAQQFGTKQTVACIGSAITEKHIALLKHITHKVVLALDPDNAGVLATEQGILQAIRGFDYQAVPVITGNQRSMIRMEHQIQALISVATLPSGLDPDECILQQPDRWMHAIEQPLYILDYFFKTKTRTLNLHESRDKTEAVQRLLPILSALSNKVEQSAYSKKLAEMTGLEERTIHHELSLYTKQNKPALRKDEEIHSGVDILEEVTEESVLWEKYILGLLYLFPENIQYIYDILYTEDFILRTHRSLFKTLTSTIYSQASLENVDMRTLVDTTILSLADPLIAYVFDVSHIQDKSELYSVSRKKVVQSALRLKRHRLLQRNSEIRLLLTEATRNKDEENIQYFWQQLSTINQLLRKIDSSWKNKNKSRT